MKKSEICSTQFSCKFRQLHFCQILFKLVFISYCYHESHRGELFLKHSVLTVFTASNWSLLFYFVISRRKVLPSGEWHAEFVQCRLSSAYVAASASSWSIVLSYLCPLFFLLLSGGLPKPESGGGMRERRQMWQADERNACVSPCNESNMNIITSTSSFYYSFCLVPSATHLSILSIFVLHFISPYVTRIKAILTQLMTFRRRVDLSVVAINQA